VRQAASAKRDEDLLPVHRRPSGGRLLYSQELAAVKFGSQWRIRRKASATMNDSQPPGIPGEIMTIPEVAGLLRLSETTVRRMCERKASAFENEHRFSSMDTILVVLFS
jgi:hypothetical protein